MYKSAYMLADELFAMFKDGRDGTISVLQYGELPTVGYFVGGEVPSLVFDAADEVDRGEIAWWVGSSNALNYGVWTDKETGKIYFDAVTHFYTREISLQIAAQRGEIAIWDITAETEIAV